MNAKFIKSAPSLRDFPKPTGFEVVMIGRSNAGKSAFINAWAKQKALARVSQKPGKTEFLNIYQMESDMFLIDTPGYGYAARGHEKRESWSPMIEEYLQNRENLRGVILVVDCVREWTVQEEDLVSWLSSNHKPTLLAVTKIDRLNQKELSKAKKHFGDVRGLVGCEYISAEKGIGIEQIKRTVFEKLISS